MNKFERTFGDGYKEPLEYIKDSLESILNQSYKHIEVIIIVDDPHNRETIEFLTGYGKRDSRIKIIINEINMGLPKSLNRGLQHCTGKYIARMDADDICCLERLEKQKNYLESKNLDLIGSQYDTFYQEIDKVLWMENVPDETELDKTIRVSSCLPHPTWFGKREVFINNKGYRDILACEDYDFLIRAKKSNFKMGNIKKTLLHYRLNPKSISHINKLEQKVIFKYLSYNYKKNHIVSFEEYTNFINKSYDYIHLKKAYNLVLTAKKMKGYKKIVILLKLVKQTETLRVYMKYK